MEVIRLNTVEEIKNSLKTNCCFEVNNKLYTTCPNCGAVVQFDKYTTKKDLINTGIILERKTFCNVQCCWDYQQTECDITSGYFFSYFTRNRESGDLIDYFETLPEAERAIEIYEKQDKKDGTFKPNFYEIYDIENQEIIN